MKTFVQIFKIIKTTTNIIVFVTKKAQFSTSILIRIIYKLGMIIFNFNTLCFDKIWY